MARSRSAHHTLNGYHYQFDKSILEILTASPNLSITLEGIEDVDVGDEAIQCKYHASQKYTRSAIKKPLLAFLTHYQSSNAPLRYTLYAHFNDHTSFTAINLDELKAIAGGEIAALGLTDSDLTVFLARHFVYEQAADMDTQRQGVHQEIVNSVGCDLSESELYFYQNALHEVIRLSRQPSVAKRTTDRAAFLRAINHKRTLFSVWLSQLKGHTEYLKFVRGELKAKQAMAKSKKRYVHIDNRLLQQSGISGLARFCRVMVDSHFKIGTVLKDAVPLLVIADASPDEIAAVKRSLLESKIPINDGFEHVAFQPWFFNAAPVINLKMTKTNPPRGTDTIAKSSYALRILCHTTYVAHCQDIDAPDTLILTSRIADAPFESSPQTDVFHVAELSNLNDLADALK